MTTAHYWACLGIPPHTAPCGTGGTRDADAEKHMKATTHGTTSGTERGARAIHHAFEESAR